MVKELPINRWIKAREVRLIGADGEQIGIVPIQRALQIAQEHGLDLVAVAPVATPPVCRLLDYGKYKYEQTKKERILKKGQRAGSLKEVRFRMKIEEHDLQAKIRTVRKLLEEGNKVRVSVRFRGREVVYPEQGSRVLRKVVEALKEIGTVSSSINEQRTIALVLSPAPTTKKPKEAKAYAKTQDS